MGNAAAFAALARVKRAVQALSRVPSQAARGASGEIRALIEAQFAAGIDAYGRAWEPHAKSTIERWGEHPIGILTGAMLGGLEVVPMAGAGIRVTLGEAYSAFFQLRRPILPTGPLPASWAATLQRASEAAFQRTMTGSV